MSFIARMPNGCCQRLASHVGSNEHVIRLKGTVGKNQTNDPDDVQKVQRGLNDVPVDKAGPAVPLLPNGVPDQALYDAIAAFKARWVPDDSSVTIGKGTIAVLKLNEIINEDRQFVSSNDQIVPVMKSLIADALSCIRAAEANCMNAQIALQLGNSPISAFGSAESLRLLKRHFDFDKQPNKDSALSYILTIYRRMMQVYERPGSLWGPMIFELYTKDDTTVKALAFTHAGGFFRNGEKEGDMRLDSIFLCESLRLCSREQAVATIVHELAHFCGPKFGNIIDDHGYGTADSDIMKRLSPFLKLHTAECYSNFAFEAKYAHEHAGLV